MGDITKINGAEIEPVDVITFGSPCQDLSIAGLRKGLAGSRSGLYVQAVRVIREMLDATNREYPKFVVFENVPGMLSSNKGNDFIAALDMMSELRFIPDPNIHDAQYCGVPQRRRRIGIAWANTDAILKKRTILSDSIMLQCLSEILLIDLTEALQVFGIEPKGQQYRAKWLSEDGRRRRIELFSLQKENALQMWQQRLDEMQATYQNAQDCSASTVGEVQMDFFTLIDVGMSTDAKTESGSISIGKLLSRQSGENSNQPNGYTTSTWTKEIMPSKICTCFQALLDILALTGAYINSAARTNSDVKSYFEWVLYILTLTKEYINARQANGTSVAKLVGDDLLRDWNIRLQACEDKVVADFGGDTASEIQFDGESVSGDIAESGAAGEGLAEAAESGFNPAVRDVTTYCLQGNGIDRADTAGCNGKGWREDACYTLNTMHDAQAVMCEDVSHALRAKANCAYREDAETYLVQNMVVRRLTPMECERLQGFPDHWTDIGEWIDEKGKKHKDADSPRYKALGNSIALPFWDWMLRRMARYLPEDATLGSLFDGISGFNVCWARIHGAECCRWSSEIEQFPIAVTKKHFGDEEAGKEGDWWKFSGM